MKDGKHSPLDLGIDMFVVFCLLTYGGMHALVYYHVRRLWAGHPLVSAFVIVFMAAMILAPIGVRLLENHGYSDLGQGLAYLGYVWMGFLFLCFCGFLLVSAGDGATRILSLVFTHSLGSLGGKTTSLLVLALAAMACTYGAMQAWDIRVERLRIETGKLPAEVPQVTIAQISDVHLGLLVRSGRLSRILAAVRAANPDILVSTGDLVDGQLDHLDDTGAFISAALALEAPELTRRVLLSAVPYWPPGPGRARMLENIGRDRPLTEDLQGLADPWKYHVTQRDPAISLERGFSFFVAQLRSEPHHARAFRAVFSWPAERTFARIAQPVGLLNIAGSLDAQTRAAAALIPNARLAEVTGLTTGAWDVAAPTLARHARALLDEWDGRRD